MDKAASQQKTISAADNAKYSNLKNDYQTIFKNILALQSEKKENL